MQSRFSYLWLCFLFAAALTTLRGESTIEPPVFADNALPINRSKTVVDAATPSPARYDSALTGTPRVASRLSNTEMVHSPSITELDDGRLLATWFGGSREGAMDVAILGAWFDPSTNHWSEAQPLITRESSQRDLGRFIKKLGNPVVMHLEGERLALFYVSVSLGGWATSQLNMVLSDDNGRSWHSTRRLVTSPFFNLSTLVKGTPYRYADGTIALPVYHEMAGKFGELLRLSEDGTVLSKTRLTTGRTAIQPVILPVTEERALALLRDSGSEAPYKAVMTRSDSSGMDWSSSIDASFYNPNSALAAVVLDCGRLLAVANDTRDERNRLTLLISEDRGANWTPIMRLEDSSVDGRQPRRVSRAQFVAKLESDMASEGLSAQDRARYLESATQALCLGKGCRYRYDYPYLIKASDGNIHLVYTWNKAYIKHRAFSQEWLSQWI